MLRTTRLQLMALAILLLALSAGSARADKPTFTNIDDTTILPGVSGLCGFPVQRHIQGKLITTERGNISQTAAANYTVTFTNLETGKFFLVRVPGLERVTETVDGDIHTFVVSYAGVGAQIVIPGQGVVAISAGRDADVFVFDYSTNPPTLISFEENATKNFEDVVLTPALVCQLLSE